MVADNQEVSAKAGSTDGTGGNVAENAAPVNQDPLDSGQKTTEKTDENGNVKDKETREIIGKLLHSLIFWTRRLEQLNG